MEVLLRRGVYYAPRVYRREEVQSSVHPSKYQPYPIPGGYKYGDLAS
jgi:hypothetical protein